MTDGVAEAEQDPSIDEATTSPPPDAQRGKTVHGEPANSGHRVLAPDDAEVEAYLETALNAPAPSRSATAAGAPAASIEARISRSQASRSAGPIANGKWRIRSRG